MQDSSFFKKIIWGFFNDGNFNKIVEIEIHKTEFILKLKKKILKPI